MKLEVYAGAFLARTHFSSFWRFIKFSRRKWKTLLSKPKTPKEICVAEDLKNIIKAYNSNKIDNFENQVETVIKIVKKVLKLKELPEIFIVDEFPKPFKGMKWIMLHVSPSSEKVYGIKRGVYVKKNLIIPYYSSITLIHELVHYYISLFSKNQEKYKQPFTLEEGICDLLLAYIALKAFPNEIVKRHMEIIYFSRKNSKLGMIYNQHFQNAYFFIYKKYGIKGLLNLAQEGWKGIYEWERERFELKKGLFDRTLENIIDEILYFPHLTLVPLKRL